MWRWMILLVVLTVGLAGCGDDPSPTNTGSDAGADTGSNNGANNGGNDGGNNGDGDTGTDTDSDASPDVPPEAIAWEGSWTCTVSPTLTVGSRDPQPGGPMLSIRLEAALVENALNLDTENRDALRDCDVTFTVDGPMGTLDSHTCPVDTWTHGEIHWVGPGFTMFVEQVRGEGEELFRLRHDFECGQAQEEDLRNLTVAGIEGDIFLIAGPEPGIDSLVELCSAGAPCTYPLPAGHSVQLMSAHPVGPPVVTWDPPREEPCQLGGQDTELICLFVLEADQSVVVEWPVYVPPRRVHTLTATMMGFGGQFSFMTDGQPVSAGCSGDCQWEVDAGTTVGATLNTTDATPDISGQNHSCQIVNNSTWACQFPMNADRTFSVTPR